MGEIIPFLTSTPKAESLLNTDHTSIEKAPEPSEEDLQEVLEIFKQARRGLTEDGVAAILALRREIAIHQALVDLLLDGRIDAEVMDRSKKLTVKNFRFWTRASDEEPLQAERLE